MFCNVQNVVLELTHNRILFIKYKIRQLTDHLDGARSSMLVVQLILNFNASSVLEGLLSS
jgi:hypothetical protein